MKGGKKIELMAPAGNFESLQAAIDNGADSVYFGVAQLNMRARAAINFTVDDLAEIAARGHSKGVFTYLTLNTIIYDHDLSLVQTLLKKAKAAGITAVIAMDQAVVAAAGQLGLAVHISTQLNVTNIETVRFYAHFADTMVLSRELSLSQIKAITDQIERERITGPGGKRVRIEVFGHGALCMAVSGKCYLSLHAYNASANRGACKQNCRKKYVVTDSETGFEIELDNDYMMSPKDLCTIDFLDAIQVAGVSVLKIEGRGRAPEYVAATTRCYREALDSLCDGSYSKARVADWMVRLNAVYNRGFWSGYYLGQKLGEWAPGSGSQAQQKKVYLGQSRHYYPEAQIGEFSIDAYGIEVGDRILITGPTTGAKQAKVKSIMIDDVKSDSAQKGDVCTLPIDFKVRPSDKLYKLVPSR